MLTFNYNDHNYVGCYDVTITALYNSGSNETTH